jgi:hypothetical protein
MIRSEHILALTCLPSDSLVYSYRCCPWHLKHLLLSASKGETNFVESVVFKLSATGVWPVADKLKPLYVKVSRTINLKKIFIPDPD